MAIFGKWSDWDVDGRAEKRASSDLGPWPPWLCLARESFRYLIDKETPTGTCAVTIVDKERSLTTRLGAANKYTVSHLKEPEQLGKDLPGNSFDSVLIGVISGHFFHLLDLPSRQAIPWILSS